MESDIIIFIASQHFVFIFRQSSPLKRRAYVSVLQKTIIL